MARKVGSVEVDVGIDVAALNRGLAEIEMGFKRIKGSTKSVNADFTRLSALSIGLSTNLVGLGIKGANAILNLAKGAPAVAGSMAQISVKYDELKRTLGEITAPAFGAFAEGFSNFVDKVNEVKEPLKKVVELILNLNNLNNDRGSFFKPLNLPGFDNVVNSISPNNELPQEWAGVVSDVKNIGNSMWNFVTDPIGGLMKFGEFVSDRIANWWGELTHKDQMGMNKYDDGS